MKYFLSFVLFTSIAHAAIYGTDDRKDIRQVPMFRAEAQAIAISIPNNFIGKKGNGNFEMMNVEKLGGSSTVYACMDEKFANQPTIGNCTGFWIGGKYLVTAGHCILPSGVVNNSTHPYCDAFSWYFDFNEDAQGKTHENNITPDKLYSCKKVIRAENIELPGQPSTNFGNDFAVIELDREVSGGVKPLKISLNKVRRGETVFTIGHPSGLPAKHSGISSVLKAENPHYFEANLDTFGGNSGGPVFNQAREVVGILVSGHQIDYYEDPKGCYRANVCDSTGKKCKENSTHSELQVSNYIQYINAITPYLKK